MNSILFDKDGHLTDHALQMLVTDKPDEMTRLEIAEHLSFCDDCLVRYTELLSGDLLETPQETCAPSVLQKIRRAAIVFFMNKYVTFAFAATAAIVLWVTGVFSNFEHARMEDFNGPTQSTSGSLTQSTARFSDEISGIISGLIDTITKKGNTSYETK